MKDKMIFVLAALWQSTYGLIQTLIGAMVMLWYYDCPHFRYRNCLMTVWRRSDGISLGLFAFVPERGNEILNDHLKRHEYGHCLQSMMLGPLYLPLIGLPSMCWNITPALQRYRRRNAVAYESFYTESWANRLGGTIQRY